MALSFQDEQGCREIWCVAFCGVLGGILMGGYVCMCVYA